MSSRRPARGLLLAAAAALAAGGCTHYVVYRGRKLPEGVAREECRKDFHACAPPPTFDVKTSPETLPIGSLVHLASRLDVDDAAAAAAAERVRHILQGHDRALLRELVAAEQSAWGTLGRCRCDPIVSELERQGLVDAIRGSLHVAQEDPAYWAQRFVERIEEIRALVRRSAELALAGLADAQARADAERAAAERELCEAVRLARGTLPADALSKALELCVQKVVQSGGDEDFARRTLEKHAAAKSCG